MSVPEPQDRRERIAQLSRTALANLLRLLRNLILLAVLGLVVAAASYLTVIWQLTTAVEPALAEGKDRAERLALRLAAVEARVDALEKTEDAATARVPDVQPDVAAGLDALQKELVRRQQETENRLAVLENLVKDRDAESTAAIVRALKFKSFLFKAQGEVLKALVDLAEGNRGQAVAELSLAEKSLQGAAGLATEADAKTIAGMLELLQKARQDLFLQSPAARDYVSLLWHTLSDFLARTG